MCADMTGSFGGGPDDGSPAGRQYPMRPVDPRQYPMRPVDPRQYPMRPLDPRQYPMRPLDPRQYPMRPYGRQYPMRPAEPQGDTGTGYLDTEEWAADIGELFCGYSALLRLGALLVFDVDDLPVPVTPVQDAPVYLPPTAASEPGEEPATVAAVDERVERLTELVEGSSAMLIARDLRPRSHELALQVALRNRLAHSLANHPDVAWALKQDIAYALALGADQGFLHGNAANGRPSGITETVGTQDPVDATGDILTTATSMVSALRRDRRTRFANPGWILHPLALDELRTKAAERPSSAEQSLLTYDGSDTGTLLGYPYVVSAAAADDPAAQTRRTRIYFSCDWSEAWVGAVRPLVTVAVSADVRFERDQTVMRAVTRHDFALRTPAAFIYTNPVEESAA